MNKHCSDGSHICSVYLQPYDSLFTVLTLTFNNFAISKLKILNSTSILFVPWKFCIFALYYFIHLGVLLESMSLHALCYFIHLGVLLESMSLHAFFLIAEFHPLTTIMLIILSSIMLMHSLLTNDISLANSNILWAVFNL